MKKIMRINKILKMKFKTKIKENRKFRKIRTNKSYKFKKIQKIQKMKIRNRYN